MASRQIAADKVRSGQDVVFNKSGRIADFHRVNGPMRDMSPVKNRSVHDYLQQVVSMANAHAERLAKFRSGLEDSGVMANLPTVCHDDRGPQDPGLCPMSGLILQVIAAYETADAILSDIQSRIQV